MGDLGVELICSTATQGEMRNARTFAVDMPTCRFEVEILAIDWVYPGNMRERRGV